MTDDEITQLQQVERQCLDRFRDRQAKLQAENPRMSASEAYGRALVEMRSTLRAYEQARAQLSAAGVPAIIPY